MAKLMITVIILMAFCVTNSHRVWAFSLLDLAKQAILLWTSPRVIVHAGADTYTRSAYERPSDTLMYCPPPL